MTIKMRINDNVDLKLIIAEKGYSPTSFANKIGVSRDYLYRLANNKRNPSVDLASLIERSLHAKHHSIFSVVNASKTTQKQSTA